LLLHTARVGEYSGGAPLELQHVQVTDWLDDADVGARCQPELREALPGARVQGQHYRLVEARYAVENALQPLGDISVLGAVHRAEIECSGAELACLRVWRESTGGLGGLLDCLEDGVRASVVHRVY